MPKSIARDNPRLLSYLLEILSSIKTFFPLSQTTFESSGANIVMVLYKLDEPMPISEELSYSLRQLYESKLDSISVHYMVIYRQLINRTYFVFR